METFQSDQDFSAVKATEPPTPCSLCHKSTHVQVSQSVDTERFIIWGLCCTEWPFLALNLQVRWQVAL